MFWVVGNWCRTWRLITEFYVLWVKIRNFSFFCCNRCITKIIQVKCVIYITAAVWLILPLIIEGPPSALTKSLDALSCGNNIFLFCKELIVQNLCVLFFFTSYNGPVPFEGAMTMLQTWIFHCVWQFFTQLENCYSGLGLRHGGFFNYLQCCIIREVHL